MDEFGTHWGSCLGKTHSSYRTLLCPVGGGGEEFPTPSNFAALMGVLQFTSILTPTTRSADPTGEGLSPTKLPPAQLQVRVANPGCHPCF